MSSTGYIWTLQFAHLNSFILSIKQIHLLMSFFFFAQASYCFQFLCQAILTSAN